MPDESRKAVAGRYGLEAPPFRSLGMNSRGVMTCDQAERNADRAIGKARWPIGNLITIAIIAAFIAVTVLAFVLGRR